jgi:GntR family transcriptional regulator
MKDVKAHGDDSLPLHDQVAAEIRGDIASGEVRPGQRLPPAKDMAAVLGVHPNTVLRALRILRDEGVLEFKRGRGITVAGEPDRGIVLSHAKELLALARRQGLGRDELVAILQRLP